MKGRMSMSIDRRDWGIRKPCVFDSRPQPLAYLSVMVGVKRKLLASFHDGFYPFVSTVQRNPWFSYTSPTLICFLDLSSFLDYMVNYQNALYLDTFSEHCFWHLTLTEICLSIENIAVLNTSDECFILICVSGTYHRNELLYLFLEH